MFDCHKDVLSYHNDDVTLPQAEQTAMRGRRDANRERLKNSLKADGKPEPKELHSQGSYTMKTMVQHPEKDYDVDDGAYFLKEELVGPRGADMSALEVRQMVQKALEDPKFNEPPELHTNCVRVPYKAGYQVDVAAYRIITEKNIFGIETTRYELASSDWKASDARSNNTWFDGENQRQSPDTDNGRQLRRITRLIKKYSKSRASWSGTILSGFGITKLVTECYKPNALREDESLHDTMEAIKKRLDGSLEIDHPTTAGDKIAGPEDAKARTLREKLTNALEWLKPLHEPDCTRGDALACWDKVFDTKYFSNRDKDTSSSKSSEKSSVISDGIFRPVQAAAVPAVNKQGGGRYA